MIHRLLSRIRRARALLLSTLFAFGLVTAGGEVRAADPPKSESARASSYYEDAVSRMATRDFDGAIIQLKNALQQDPRMLPAMVLMGEAYLELGNGAAAETALNEAAQSGADVALTAVPLAKAYLLQFKQDQLVAQALPARLPLMKRAEWLEVKAQAALQINDKQTLRQILDEIDRIDPNAIAALSIKATVAMRDGRLDEAERYLERATRTAPNNPTVWLTRASLNHVRDNRDQALADYAEVIKLDPSNRDARLARLGLLLDLGRDQETDEDMQYLAEKGGSDPRLTYLRATKLARAGDEHGARAALNEAANILEAMGRPIVLRNTQLLLIAGVINYTLDNREAAKLYLEEYIKSAGDEIETRKMLATVLMRQGDHRRAAKLIEEVIDLAGESPELLVILARAYTGAEEHPRATAALERAATLRPNDPRLATDLAISRAKRGQMDTALGDLARIFSHDEYQKIAGLPLAIMQMNRGDYAAAADVAGKLLQDDPDNLTYMNLLGVANIGLGKLREARALFDRALARDPAYQPAELNLGKLDRREGQFDAAERRFNRLLGKKPNDAQLLLELARTFAAKGDLKNALKLGRGAAEVAPESFEIALFLIEQHVANKDSKSAHDLAWNQDKLHPNNLYVMEAEVNILGAEGKFGEMRPLLKRMADQAQSDIDWLLRIAALQRRGNLLSDAQYTLFKAVQSQPDSFAARLGLAEVELNLAHLDAAGELAAGLARDFPDQFAGHALLGDVEIARGQPANGVQHFAKAMAVAKQDVPDLALKRHLALRAAGENDAAAGLLEEWQKRYPQAAWIKGALGEHAMHVGRYQVAKARFEEFLKLQPDHVPTMNNLANVLLKLESPDGALALAQKAYAAVPDNPYVNDTLGWILVNRGEGEQGLRYLREARTRAATIPEIRYHLAVALHKQGRGAEARTELAAALETGQDFDGRGDALRLSEELGG
ncbi:MAG: PEP-CTERM system TPR-repeat protein PrsT [Gammaproteobacteria bacterium]|nr:PEP-CTERM system TPR-repeat protein PrsT [Gammaproteobacteria bacterium]